VKNLKNISSELREERTCQRGAPEHLKRGQAGRPRAFLALIHLNFLWWLSGAIICFCPVHLSCFAPSKSRGPLLFLPLMSTCNIISSLCVLHLVTCFIIHHMVPSLLKITCPSHVWLLRSLDYLHVVIGREHNSFP